MKKVLAVLDGAHFLAAISNFALHLNNIEPMLLTGIFLPSADYAAATEYLYYGNAVVPAYLEAYDTDPAVIKQNISRFESFCDTHHIRYRVHKEIKKDIVSELKLESRFADLMLLSDSEFYNNQGPDIQDEYLHETLHHAECPVLLLPDNNTVPDHIVLAYDGSASSMCAIRQFIYTMPELTDLETLVVYAGNSHDDLPFINQLKEYLPQHFNKLAYYRLDADPRKYFDTWITNKGNPLLVSGSYGRSPFSEMLRKSFITEIVKEHKLPVFVAHH